MSWNQGLGRIVRIGAWAGFAACFVFGTALSWLYGQPCPGQLPAEGVDTRLMVCATNDVAQIGNINTLSGLVLLTIALFATGASRAERRREAAHRLRQLQAQERHPGPVRVSLARRTSEEEPVAPQA